MTRIRTAMMSGPLDVTAAIVEVSSPDCGGLGVFVGTVRRSPSAGRADEPVEALEYEAHPTLAEHRLHDIAERAAARWDVRKIVALHREGRCAVEEPTVLIACAAPHRADALEACRWMIDAIKEEVPIWKKEIYADGSVWVGAGS